MPFLTRPHFEDRQIVQYSNESISLSGTSYIAATVLDFSGTTTGETAVTINSLTGYLNGQRLSSLVIEPAQLKLSGTTGTTTQNVTGFVLQSIDPYGAVEWAPLSGVSWSVSACTSPLYVSTIEACPNPTDPIYITAGNVQFGASPSLIADITNTRLGIGTGSPSESLHIESGDILVQNSSGERFYSDMDNPIGPRVLLSADTNSLYSMNITGQGFGGQGGMALGIRGVTEGSFPGYGKQGDSYIYSSAYNNGLNIISQPTSGPQITDDYIRFYAGQDANGTTPDLYIQGSGATRGNIGINTDIPTEKLHIQDGDLLIAHNQNENTKININNFGGSSDSKSTINFQISGSSLITSVAGTISAIGPDSIPTGTFMGNYLPNSLNITTAGGSLSNRMHINIGSRRGSDAQTRFFGGSDDFNSSSLLGIFYTSGLTITDMVNTDTLRVRDGATLGHVLTSDANGNATWQYNSTGFSGNTSASCITDLYVSNIYGCSPITIHDSVQHTGSTASGTKSVAFGLDNVTNSDNSAILGGNDNNIDSSDNSFIGGGKFNTITGGTDNFIAAGGFASVANSNQILGASRSFIGGGRVNKILTSDSSIAGGQFNELSGQGSTFIGGGASNTINGNAGNSSIVGGQGNTVDIGKYSFVGGGIANSMISSQSSVIGGGGSNNLHYSSYSSIVGGQDNTLSGNSTHSSIIGGQDNTLSGSSTHSSIVGGQDNTLSSTVTSLISGGIGNTLIGGRYDSMVGGDTNTLINANNAFIGGGENNTLTSSNNAFIGGGGINNITNSSLYSFIGSGLRNNLSGASYSSIVGGEENTLSGTSHSSIVGGNDILGTTDNTVYTPNLTVRGDYVLHSDEVLEVGDVPGSLESTMKGSYTEFNHNLTTANVISNSNTSGFTSVIIGDLSNYPTKKSYGFISYYNSEFTRTGTPPVGTDFNRGKLVFKASEDAVGMVINPRAGDPTAPLWFEMDGRSVMKLQGDGAGKATLGIAMSEDGTETASANLQIGGTGTTGTFKYIDGNEQSGYVLTSDADGNATWQVSSASGGTGGGTFTGNTSGDCITDLYLTNLYGCSPITVHDTITYNGSIIDSATTNSFIFGDLHVLTGSTGTHGVDFDANVLLGGSSNRITPFQVGKHNTIIGGEGNKIGTPSRVSNSAIISSYNSIIGASALDGGNVIIGGKDSIISGGGRNVIVGGDGGVINSGVDHSVILGGQNITGTTDDTVYVPILNINNIVSGGTSVNNLGIDASGNVVTGTAGGGGATIDPYQDVGNVNSITWDVSGTSTNYEATLTGNTTLDLANVRNGDYGTIVMEQDGVGSHTLTLGTVNGGGGTHKVVNGGGGTIVLTGTANSIDLLTFTYNGNIVWWSIGPNYT